MAVLSSHYSLVLFFPFRYFTFIPAFSFSEYQKLQFIIQNTVYHGWTLHHNFLSGDRIWVSW